MARTATNSVARMKVVAMRNVCPEREFFRVEVKIAAVSALTMRMFMYSAMKIKAKFPPPYSTLNPDTSSDSPSAKSNGVRLVSARTVTNQHMKRRGIKNRDQDRRSSRGVVKLYLISKSRLEKRKSAILIS